MNGWQRLLQFINGAVSRMVKLVQSVRGTGGTSIRDNVEVVCWDRYRSGQCPHRVNQP